MPRPNHISYLRRNEIDLHRWDACIKKADNGLIYAYSYYLDAMCTDWDGLVLNDYEAVMPLPWRKKWGINYLYQPYFTPVLGIFGSNMAVETTTGFFDAIPKKFLYCEIHLNEQNLPEQQSLLNQETIRVSERRNYLLDIEPGYEAVKRNYKRLAKRKLIIAQQNHFQIKREELPSVIIQQYVNHYKEQHNSIKIDDYKRLERFCQSNKSNILTYTASNPKGDIAGFYLLFIDDENIYSILGGSTHAGKEAGAFYLLTDAVIKDYSGKQKVFRFEGSDHAGIAFFNSQFGPTPIRYYHIIRNNLPWPISIFKK